MESLVKYATLIGIYLGILTGLCMMSHFWFKEHTLKGRIAGCIFAACAMALILAPLYAVFGFK